MRRTPQRQWRRLREFSPEQMVFDDLNKIGHTMSYFFCVYPVPHFMFRLEFLVKLELAITFPFCIAIKKENCLERIQSSHKKLRKPLKTMAKTTDSHTFLRAIRFSPPASWRRLPDPNDGHRLCDAGEAGAEGSRRRFTYVRHRGIQVGFYSGADREDQNHQTSAANHKSDTVSRPLRIVSAGGEQDFSGWRSNPTMRPTAILCLLHHARRSFRRMRRPHSEVSGSANPDCSDPGASGTGSWSIIRKANIKCTRGF